MTTGSTSTGPKGTAPLIGVFRGVRLGLAGAVASRSLLAATFAWLLVLFAVYASDAGAPLAAAAFTAAALLPIAAWATAAFRTSASVDLRALLTAADGPRRLLTVDAVLAALWVGSSAVVGVLAGVIFDPHPDSLVHRLLALAVHLACGAVGVALALLLDAGGLSRGTQLAVVVVATVASGRLAWLPPDGPVLAAWGTDRAPAPALAVWSLAGPALLGTVLLVATERLRRRRA